MRWPAMHAGSMIIVLQIYNFDLLLDEYQFLILHLHSIIVKHFYALVFFIIYAKYASQASVA